MLTKSRQSIIVLFCYQNMIFKRLQHHGEEIITIYQQMLKCEIKLCRAWENCIILYNMYTQQIDVCSLTHWMGHTRAV